MGLLKIALRYHTLNFKALKALKAEAFKRYFIGVFGKILVVFDYTLASFFGFFYCQNVISITCKKTAVTVYYKNENFSCCFFDSYPNDI